MKNEEGGTTMALTVRDMTSAEIEEFLSENRFGILAFAGDKPYALPLGYSYRKGTVILGFRKSGRKMDYFQKSRNVCFTVSVTKEETTNVAGTLTSVLLEGELEEVTDRDYYGLPPLPSGASADLASFRIKTDQVGARAWTRTSP